MHAPSACHQRCCCPRSNPIDRSTDERCTTCAAGEPDRCLICATFDDSGRLRWGADRANGGGCVECRVEHCARCAADVCAAARQAPSDPKRSAVCDYQAAVTSANSPYVVFNVLQLPG